MLVNVEQSIWICNICNEEQSMYTIDRNQTMSVDEECYSDREESTIVNCCIQTYNKVLD